MTKFGHVADCCHYRTSGHYAAGAGAGAGAASAGGAGAFSTAGAGAGPAAGGAATPHPPVPQPVLQPPHVLQAPQCDFRAQHGWHEPQLGAGVQHAVQLGAGAQHGAGVLHVLQSLAQWCLGLQ